MRFLEQAWYRRAGWLVLLWPFSLLFQLIAASRRRILTTRAAAVKKQVPVVIIGNISVGGTGKTPLLIRIGKALQKAGFKPGVISRGYLGKAPGYPLIVRHGAGPEDVGDEAALIVSRLNCPMVVDPDRVRALATITEEYDCDVILSDDGLQHYALPRDIEIAVVDGARLFGNGLCLPAGPLREPVSRLASVPYIVINGAPQQSDLPAELIDAIVMEVNPTYLVNLQSGDKKPFRGAPFNIGTKIHAVAAIGNPERFFNLLGELPYDVTRHEFPDHHPFSEEDFDALGIDDRQPIVMTEKDAVKCRPFAGQNVWYLMIDVKLPETFLAALIQDIRSLGGQGD